MVPITLTILCLGASSLLLVQMLWLASQGKDGPRLPDEEVRKHLVWKAFYVNPADPRGWLPKIWGIGWTVNYRNRGQVYVFVSLLLASLLSALALVVSVV